MRLLMRFCVVMFVFFGFAMFAAAQNYYPDRVGNRWVLRSTDELDTRVNEVVRKELLRDRLVTVFEGQTNDNPPDRLYVVTENDGIWIHRAEVHLGDFNLEFDYNPPQVFLPIPLNLDTTWTVSGEAMVADTIISTNNRGQVVAIEDVTVPAGTFLGVFKIRQDIELSFVLGQLSFQRFMWLAPDVGIVKEINTSDVVFELVDYDVVVEGPIAVRTEGKLPITWAYLKSNVP